MDKISDYGNKLASAAADIFAPDDAEEEDEDFIEVGADDGLTDSVPIGHGYQLSYTNYGSPGAYGKSYFFSTQLGAPFPSYHTNPMPRFPARWTSIPNVKPPCESILAPRIRLAPQELKQAQGVLSDLIIAAKGEDNQPTPMTLNLSHQALGDPYQYTALRAFLAVNRFVRILNLNDNELDSIADLELPNCVKLHLSHNNFINFEGLPDLPNCEELYMKDNFLSGPDGLGNSKFPKLRVLTVELNPLIHINNYGRMLHANVNALEWVDGEKVTRDH